MTEDQFAKRLNAIMVILAILSYAAVVLTLSFRANAFGALSEWIDGVLQVMVVL